MKRGRYTWMQGAGLASTVGILLVVCTAIGYFAGAWLDRKFGTDPWLMLVLTVMGMAAGFIEMFRILLLAIREQDEDAR